MRRTLLFIPHEVAGIPVFGVGWLLAFVFVFIVTRIVWSLRQGRSAKEVLANDAPFIAILIGVIVFVLPGVELRNIDDEPLGMAIRGYGVMLLAGVGSAVGLAWYRAKKWGLNPEWILSLAPWVFVGGIFGARLFYVVQYRERFIADTLAQTVRNMLAFTEGGLVVYGSFIGGFIAASIYIIRKRLPLLALGDVIVPCMFLGLFFGRMGCLMNGCCYGGRCDDSAYALYFPPGSPVYQDQLRSGELIGVAVNPTSGRIATVEPESLASRAGIASGSRVERLQETYPGRDAVPRDIVVEEIRPGLAALIDGKVYQWTAAELPMRAKAVQPAQLMSSVGAILLCAVLCIIRAGTLRTGAIMLIGFIGYAKLRFVMEVIRVDEAGQFGTSLSISQWVSIVVFVLSLSALAWIYMQPVADLPSATRRDDGRSQS